MYKKDSLNQVLTSDQLTLVTSKQVPSKKKKMMIKVVAIFLLSALLVASALEAPGAPSPVDCGDKCGKRCQNAGVKDRCLKYCGICCRECKCVPSGTYGNKHECPCYRDKLSSKGKPKCP